jgi:hypothetical protein
MYKDYLLKFETKEYADEALFTKETTTVDDVEETCLRPNYAAIDIIGTIYKPTGEMLDVEGQEVPEMVAVTGYHVNVRHTSDAPELQEFVVNPKTPTRVWC